LDQNEQLPDREAHSGFPLAAAGKATDRTRMSHQNLECYHRQIGRLKDGGTSFQRRSGKPNQLCQAKSDFVANAYLSRGQIKIQEKHDL